MLVAFELDDELCQSLRELTGLESDTESVQSALRTYVHREYRDRLLAMRGSIAINDNWEALRMLELRESESP